MTTPPGATATSAAGQGDPEGSVVIAEGRTLKESVSERFPHHWTVVENGVRVSRRLETAALAAGARALDPRAVFDYLVLGSVIGCEPTRTLVEGVRRVPPGCEMQVGSPTPAIRIPRQPESPLTFADSLRTVVSETVSTDRPIGVLASGGLDSSVIAALARDAGAELVLLCAPLGLSSDDEIAYQKLLAAHLSAELVRCEQPAPLGPTLDMLNDGAPWPTGGLFAGVFADLGRICSERGIERVLSGDGADDLLNPPGVALADGLASRDVGRAWSAWADVGAMAAHPLRSAAALGFGPLFARRNPRVALGLLNRLPSSDDSRAFLTREFLQSGVPQARRARIESWAAPWFGEFARASVAADVAAGAEAAYDLPVPGGQRVARVSPFRDGRVVAAALNERVWSSTPSRAGVLPKSALRAAAAGLLPEAIRLAEKTGRWDLASRFVLTDGSDIAARISRLSERLPTVIRADAAAARPDDLPVEASGAWVRLLCLEAWLTRLDQVLGVELPCHY